MAQPPETFEQFLERTLADSGLRSYGHNTLVNEAAEEMCYQRALECFNLTAPPWWGIHSAPLGEESPPWGIHSPEGEEVRHGATVPDEEAPRRANPKDHPDRVFPTWGGAAHIPATAEPVHNDAAMSYSFDGAARGLIEHHLSRIRLHLTQIGHVLDANLDK